MSQPDGSELAFGAWAIGGEGWGARATEDQRRSAVQAALEQGITFFDTAPTYGRSEELLGDVLKDARSEVRIATKVGPRDDPAQSLERSLRRLQTDYVDLVQLHEVGDKFEASLESLVRIKEQGKALAIGLCNARVDQLRAAAQLAPLHSYQAALNLFDREVEQRELPLCRERGLDFLAYRPLASGALTDKFSADFAAGLDPTDHRRGIWWFQGRELGRRLQVADRLRPLAKQTGRTLPGLALAWAMSRPGVRYVLAGARTAEQVRQNVTGARRLGPEEAEAIDAIVRDVYRPARATPEAAAAAAEWGQRERFIVEHLDGHTTYEQIASKWSDEGTGLLMAAQVREFVDQLEDAEMVSFP